MGDPRNGPDPVLLQFAIVLLDPPADFGDAIETPQPKRLGTELSQPVLGGLLFAFGPFYQQLLPHARRVSLFPLSVSRPHRQSHKWERWAPRRPWRQLTVRPAEPGNC